MLEGPCYCHRQTLGGNHCHLKGRLGSLPLVSSSVDVVSIYGMLTVSQSLF